MILSPFQGLSEGYRIELNLKQAAGKDVYLTQYYLGNVYSRDTARLDNNGYGVFDADSLLPQGLYKIYLDQHNHFDILVGEQQRFLVYNETFSIDNIRIDGSDEVRAFVEYALFLKNLQKESSELKSNLESVDENNKAALHDHLEELNTKLYDYWERLEKEMPGSFLAKFVKATYVPTLDEFTLAPQIQQNDSIVKSMKYYYQREHFWDNFDYTDERFLYTPFFKPKLETWFNKVLFQYYDSVKPYVIDFIEEVKPNKRIFQFVTSFFLNCSINSNIMGMDALFVDIARRYYVTGEAFWSTIESMEKIKENLMFFENNLIGMTAPDIILESFEGEFVNLHQLVAPYTIIVIYEPDCSHCNVFVPELYSKVFIPFKDKGLKVFAIYSMDNKKDWEDFITEHSLDGWINVWDENHSSRFKILYDARYTPGVYILDENKTIIGKKMSVDQIRNFLEQHLK